MNPHDELRGEDYLPTRPSKDIPAADMDLLELAARAIGAELDEIDGEEWVNLHFKDGSKAYAWNPLVYGDDALNLMAALQMQVDYNARGQHSTGGVTVACGPNIYLSEPKDGDVAAATRRAITRAAAEFGLNR